MHLTKLATSATSLLLLAGPAAADHWVIKTECYHNQGCATPYGDWYTAFRSWYFPYFSDGCHVPYITSVASFCIDWNYRRGHFWTDWNERRCLRQTSERLIQNDAFGQIWETIWEERTCEWRLAATDAVPTDHSVANGTAVPAPSASAEAKRAVTGAKFKPEE